MKEIYLAKRSARGLETDRDRGWETCVGENTFLHSRKVQIYFFCKKDKDMGYKAICDNIVNLKVSNK